MAEPTHEAVRSRPIQSTVRTGSAPRVVLCRYSPCLVLIDEWVAYARQLYGKDDLPAGSFDAQFTFAQAIAEAARSVEGALLVVSIPSSDIEVGGDGGRAALERLKNVIGRMESSWRPASAEEGFEIVRRRLFDDIPAAAAPSRDAPGQQAANRGIDDRSIKLGCVQPGESPATFGDALRRLTDQATYLYVDGQRYWYSLQPSVTRLAQDRAASHFTADDVDEEIRRRLAAATRSGRPAIPLATPSGLARDWDGAPGAYKPSGTNTLGSRMSGSYVRGARETEGRRSNQAAVVVWRSSSQCPVAVFAPLARSWRSRESRTRCNGRVQFRFRFKSTSLASPSWSR